MNTPSHFLMTAALRKAAPTAGIVTSAFLIGSVAPDVPLYMLSLGGIVYFQGVLGWPAGRAFEHMYDHLYFSDPWWLGLHNVLHAPIVLLFLLMLSRVARLRLPRLSAWVFWFACAALLHGAVDVFTHNDDGPLILWPIEWTVRFSSPVSYWNPGHYGRQFFVFEAIFDASLLVYLLAPWIGGKLGRRAPKARDGSVDSSRRT